MAVSNRERLDRGFQELAGGLAPFMQRELARKLGADWPARVLEGFEHERDIASVMRDPQKLLKILTIPPFWNPVFKSALGNTERSYANECLTVRNKWAHNESLTYRDTERALDTMERLLRALPAPAQAQKLDDMRMEVQRVIHAEASRSRTRTAQIELPGMTTQAGLKPWRDVVEPHRDVATGNFQKAEFAADLAQVYRGDGQAEYADPQAFFERTFMTGGLKGLLSNALQRLSGTGGDPVIELQTSFGGGKTHSMLALYHMAGSGGNAALSGLEEMMADKHLDALPQAHRAVLVGTDLSPNEGRPKPDGITTRTLWGEMAWQLGRADGYARVEKSDQSGAYPGADVLESLLRKFSPCLILIDEWVAFLRSLYSNPALLAGSFDNNLSFAQALCEAVRRVDTALLVASLPASNMEAGAGGEGGEQALQRLGTTFGRMQSSWQPATSLEGHEIVRRRLFRSGMDFAARDASIRAFTDMYRKAEQDFPGGVSEADYRRKMQSAYPLHPELFERLHNDWGSLEKFQRTRGVLRLMAGVISVLWHNQDKSLMILPSSVPLEHMSVSGELLRYIDPAWQSVLEKDVDGPGALSRKIDRDTPALGKYSATRRVARTIFLGATPTARGDNPGIDARAVKLGCTQPGEKSVHFSDALGRLAGRSSYLHSAEGKHWFSTQVTLNSTAADYANNNFDAGDVENAIVDMLRREKGQNLFSRVHAAPLTSADIPDEDRLRLVILHPKFGFLRTGLCAGRTFIEETLKSRGTGARIYRNGLIFMAPDKKRLQELEQAVRMYLAWNLIVKRKGEGDLNLTASDLKMAISTLETREQQFKSRLHETWRFVVFPAQDEPEHPDIDWGVQNVTGDGKLADRVQQKLRDSLPQTIGPQTLSNAIDHGRLWRDKDHIATLDLWLDFAKYLFLPKLVSRETLVGCISNAIADMANESFGYADGYDGDNGKYLGLKVNRGGSVTLSKDSLLVKYDVARTQLDRQQAPQSPPAATASGSGVRDTPPSATAPAPGERKPTRFWASTPLEPTRPHKLAGQVTEEVLQHLLDQPGAKVRISLEISADCPQGLDDNIRRTLRENCNTLGIDDYGIE